MKNLLYSPEDIKEFSIQIKELLENNLIRPSKGSYSSSAFMVMNEAEKEEIKLEWLSTIKN